MELIYKLRELLKEIWDDFLNPASRATSSSTAFSEDDLRAEPIRVDRMHKNYISYLKNKRS